MIFSRVLQQPENKVTQIFWSIEHEFLLPVLMIPDLGLG